MNPLCFPAALAAASCLLMDPAPSQQVADASATCAVPVTVAQPRRLPHAITSFGACRVDNWLYVFGGHVGKEHRHTKENVLGAFHRLDLAGDGEWQALPDGPALQGTALVAAPDGTIYRVGGMTAHNAPGEDDGLHSTASVARFDPRVGEWQETTPLPEPRSSHDAIVCDNRLYVIGGWQLAGGGDGEWHDTAWVADLAQQPLVWQPLPAPDRRRACAVATFAGKVAVLGGIDAKRPIASVRVFDPATGQWSDGPALPGFAFGTAALGVGDWLHATVIDGRLLRWNGAGDWQPVAQLELPRFFHRMVEATEPGRIVAFGGAGRGGHMSTMESVRIDGAGAREFEIREHRLPAPGRVAHRQALLLRDNVLWAFGGNRALPGDRFAAEQFATDVWRIELATMTATIAGELPHGCQSMAAVVWGDRRDNLVLGGLGVVDGAVQSLATGFRWEMRRQELLPFPGLPAPRTQLALVEHGGKVFAIGGTDFTPDGDGGSERDVALDVLVSDPAATAPAFAPSGMQLPRPRRSFGAAVLGEQLFLIGGLGGGFAHAGPGDVFDFANGEWRELTTPVDWVSPQVAVIGDRLYVACGGTMKGQRFTEDRSLWSYDAGNGWRRVLHELPFAVRHVQMRALRNRLLFYSVEDGEVVVRTLEPDRSVQVPDTPFHR